MSDVIEFCFNGESMQVREGTTLSAYLQTQALPSRYIVVRNNEIVPSSQIAKTYIQPRDTIDIMTAMSGG